MGLYAYFARDLPDPGTLSHRQLFQTARIFDRSGKLLQEVNDPQGGRRTVVQLSDIPMVMRDATIAAEDASFYDNPGFDIRAVVRATYQWVRSGSPQSGASTITQQLVKNTLLGPEQTAERKIKEAFLAMELTRRYSKDQILEMYMNEISYGNRAYGIEAAAETYFGKQARDLSLAEKSATDHIAALRQRNATNAALVAIQPSSGEVLAMLGSVDFNDPKISGQVNVALSLRQPGSTLKPFTYVTAFGKGWNPTTMMWDIPTTFPGGYKPNEFDNK